MANDNDAGLLSRADHLARSRSDDEFLDDLVDAIQAACYPTRSRPVQGAPGIDEALRKRAEARAIRLRSLREAVLAGRESVVGDMIIVWLREDYLRQAREDLL